MKTSQGEGRGEERPTHSVGHGDHEATCPHGHLEQGGGLAGGLQRKSLPRLPPEDLTLQWKVRASPKVARAIRPVERRYWARLAITSMRGGERLYPSSWPRGMMQATRRGGHENLEHGVWVKPANRARVGQGNPALKPEVRPRTEGQVFH